MTGSGFAPDRKRTEAELVLEELGCEHRWSRKPSKHYGINYCLDCKKPRFASEWSRHPDDDPMRGWH